MQEKLILYIMLKVYKLYGLYYLDTLVYIGSTKNSLSTRFSQHKTTNTKSLISIFMRYVDVKLMSIKLIREVVDTYHHTIRDLEDEYIIKNYHTILNINLNNNLDRSFSYMSFEPTMEEYNLFLTLYKKRNQVSQNDRFEYVKQFCKNSEIMVVTESKKN